MSLRDVPHVVRDAIIWLSNNNRLYKDLEIPMSLRDFFTQNQSNFQPQDTIQEEFGTCPSNHSADNLNSDANQYCSFTPGLISSKNTPFSESKSFPRLFPFGKGCMHEDRPIKITDTQYFLSRFYNVTNA